MVSIGNGDEIHGVNGVNSHFVNVWILDFEIQIESRFSRLDDPMIPPSIAGWLILFVPFVASRRVHVACRQDESKWNPISVAELGGHLPQARLPSLAGTVSYKWCGDLPARYWYYHYMGIVPVYGDLFFFFTNWYYNDQWWLIFG